MAIKMKSLLNEEVKITKVDVKIDHVDEWISLVVDIKGKWDRKIPKEELLKVLFDPTTKVGKEFQKKVNTYRGKWAGNVKIPIPTRPNDFEDWDVMNNHAWFSVANR